MSVMLTYQQQSFYTQNIQFKLVLFFSQQSQRLMTPFQTQAPPLAFYFLNAKHAYSNKTHAY